MLQICGRAECHPRSNESCEKPCSEWKASSSDHIGEQEHPAFSFAHQEFWWVRGTNLSSQDWLLHWFTHCSSKSCGVVAFLRSQTCVCVCVRVIHKYMWAVPIGWTHWCDLHESAGSCNYQQPMQNLPNLYWHGFKEEAPLSADLSLTPPFTRSPRNNGDTLIQRAVCVFSAWGRGRPITSLSPRSLLSHCVVVITTVWKGMFVSYLACGASYLIKSLQLSIVSLLND